MQLASKMPLPIPLSIPVFIDHTFRKPGDVTVLQGRGLEPRILRAQRILLLGLSFAVELFEEVEDEGELGDGRVLASGNPEYDDAFAVWAQVKIYCSQAIREL